MDEKNLVPENRSSSSDSSKREDEDIEDTLSSNSPEPSLDKKCVFEASVAEDCSIHHENSSMLSDDNLEKFCTASYAEMDRSNRINAYDKSSLGSENLISTRSRAFTEHREQSGYSADNSASGSSTANVSDEEVSPPRTFERHFFSNELKNDTNIAGCSYGNNTINPYAVDTQASSSTQQIGKNWQNSDALRRYFDSLEKANENIATNQQPIITQSEEKYKGIEDGDNDTLNPLENLSGIKSSLNNVIHGIQRPQLYRLPFKVNWSYMSDEPKTIIKNNDPVLPDMKEIEPCPKISPIDGESGKEKSLNDISEIITCSKLPNNSENIRRDDSSPKNRERISPSLNIPSIDKENDPKDTDVSQYGTLKRSRSYSPTKERESKIMKPSSAAENPTRTLRNVDINLTKRPAPPDDKLSPESHNLTQGVKKQKID